MIKNCGFVNCEWQIKGHLKKNKQSSIYADGRTYDNKLYTFKEIDYREVWHELDVIIQKLDNKKHNWGNISNRQMKADIGERPLDSNGFELDMSIQQDITPDF